MKLNEQNGVIHFSQHKLKEKTLEYFRNFVENKFMNA